MRLYFRECFIHPIFILFYLSQACTVLTKGLNPAGIFHLHLGEHQAKVWPARTSQGGQITGGVTPDGRWCWSRRDAGRTR